jgi:hypothetical protein
MFREDATKGIIDIVKINTYTERRFVTRSCFLSLFATTLISAICSTESEVGTTTRLTKDQNKEMVDKKYL